MGKFTDIPLGNYTLKEVAVGNYTAARVTASNPAAKIISTSEVQIPVNASTNEYVITFENKKTEPEIHGDQRSINNHIPMHIPVKLELKYVGANPVSNDRLTSYTFKESDFDPKKGGDMVVTYDDESQISLSKGTLKFNQVTLSPGTVTNLDNSANPMTVYATY